MALARSKKILAHQLIGSSIAKKPARVVGKAPMGNRSSYCYCVWKNLIYIGWVSVLLGVTGCKSLSAFHTSNTYVQVERSVGALRTNGEYPSAKNASQAVDLIEKALAQADLKSREREALKKQAEAARETFQFLEFIDHSWNQYGPGIRANDPYVNEASLRDYLAAIQSEKAAVKRPAYREALDKHYVDMDRQLNEISRRIRGLEKQYSFNLTQMQFDFIQQAAQYDVALARNKYKAGKRPWYWLDDKSLIAQGLRPVRRVEASPRVHASIRADAESVDQLICASLSYNRITMEVQRPRLPAYETELSYPADTDLAKRQWVKKQWEQNLPNSLVIPQL